MSGFWVFLKKLLRVSPRHVSDYIIRTAPIIEPTDQAYSKRPRETDLKIPRLLMLNRWHNVAIFSSGAFRRCYPACLCTETSHLWHELLSRPDIFQFFFWNAARSKALTGGGLLITLISLPVAAVALQNKRSAPFISRAALMLNAYARCRPASVIQL